MTIDFQTTVALEHLIAAGIALYSLFALWVGKVAYVKNLQLTENSDMDAPFALAAFVAVLAIAFAPLAALLFLYHRSYTRSKRETS